VGKVALSPDDPLVGRSLPGGYLILELVGIGGMGRVYRAEQTTLGRTVAVKIIHPHLVGEENAAARFITEARAASRLNHPHSVGIIDFGKSPDGLLYLVMEFLRGRDLARVIYEDGPLPFRRIVDVLQQTLAALAEAHNESIIHRDLKPENIILEPVRSGGDFVKVVDFGLAKIRADTTQPSITSPGIVCGTPEYMSPEQARGDVLDARSDLYAVGVILYQLLAGRLPFEAESPTQVVLAHLTQQPRDPSEVAPERKIPQVLVDVTLKMLAKEPVDRYSDADELAAALGDALATIEKLSRDPAALNAPLTTWIPRVFFLLLPLFAVLLALFYVRQRKQFYFVDHLVFSLSVHSFVFAILIVAIGAAQLLPGGRVAEIIFLSIGVYLFIALKRFYRQGWIATAVKFAAISFIYAVFVLAPALVFVLVTGFIQG